MKALLRLYPRRWRRLYGSEMEALLEQTPATPKAAFDLVRGALDAHLHREWRGCTAAPGRRPRSWAGSIIAIAAFVAASLGVALVAQRAGMPGAWLAAGTVSGILLGTVTFRLIRSRRKRRGRGPQDPGQGARVPASPLPDSPPALAAASRGSGRRSGPE
jgi:hypothetical protein